LKTSGILCLLAGLALAQAARGGTLYAVNQSDNGMYRLDKATGAATLIGPTGQFLDIPGMTFDPSTGLLVVSNAFVPGSLDAFGIGFAKPGTAAVSTPHDFQSSLSIPSVAYHRPSDTLYGLSINPYRLSTIDRASGVATAGPVPFADPPTVVRLLGIAFSRDGATLYAVSEFLLHQVDRASGHVTTIGPHGLDLGDVNTFGVGLAIDPDDGTFFLVHPVTGDLYRLDPATGAATRLGPTGIRPTGIAASGSATVEVPALGPAGLIGLALLLAVIGLLFAKRRRPN